MTLTSEKIDFSRLESVIPATAGLPVLNYASFIGFNTQFYRWRVCMLAKLNLLAWLSFDIAEPRTKINTDVKLKCFYIFMVNVECRVYNTWAYLLAEILEMQAFDNVRSAQIPVSLKVKCLLFLSRCILCLLFSIYMCFVCSENGPVMILIGTCARKTIDS